VYSETNITLDCGGTEFSAKGKATIIDGWKAIQATFTASLKEKPEDERGGEAALPKLSEGQALGKVAANVKEGETSPPRPYTEGGLLAAMESAGAEDMPEDAERRGIGTPATRAGVIEKIIKSGFARRQKKNLIPTEAGKNLIAILPDMLKSPALTAQWEDMLGQIERGELSADTFMGGIVDMTRSLVAEHGAPNPDYISLFAATIQDETLGVCPRCGGAVREGKNGFFCDTSGCRFKMWKDSKFWTAKKKTLTAKIVVALLKDGCVALKNLYSEKTGKAYDATAILDDTGDGYVNFKLVFDKGDKS